MKWLISIFIIFSSMACKKYLDWEIIDKGRKPVINAIFITDSIPKIYVYESVHILDKSDKKIINQAQIQIFYNQQQYLIPYNHIQECYYLDSITFSENEQIKLMIQTPIGNTEKDITIVSKIQQLTIDTTSYKDNSGNRIGVNVKIKWKDEANKKNYYILYVTHNDNIHYIDVNDMSVKQQFGVCFLTDELFNGEYKTIQTTLYTEMYDDNIELTNSYNIYVINADEHTYKYYYSSKKQISAKYSPFSEPVMVYSNVTNGYGIIGSYSISKFILYIP